MARTRIAAIVAAVGLAALVMAPAAAMAATKAATKITVNKSQVEANWSTPGVTPPAPSVTVKLYKKSGTKWVALKGAISMQMEDATTKAWGSKLTSKPTSSVSFALPNRGRYRFVYAGNSATKPATVYSKRVDLIGEVLAPAGFTRSDYDNTWTQVSASFTVTWNVEAFHPAADSAPLEFSLIGAFDNKSPIDADWQNSGNVYFYQEMWQPGTVWLSYRVRTLDIPDNLANVGADTEFFYDCTMISDDKYVLIAETSEIADFATPTFFK